MALESSPPRIHPRWVPKAFYLAWLPADTMRWLERYLGEEDIFALEVAFLCRPAPGRRRAGGPGADDARAALISECARRGQFAARPATLLQSLREARVSRETPAASALELLPVGLLDEYLPRGDLVGVELALVPAADAWEAWSAAGAEDGEEAGPPGEYRPAPLSPPAGGPGAAPRLSGRQRQRRGEDRRARAQGVGARVRKPWASRDRRARAPL